MLPSGWMHHWADAGVEVWAGQLKVGVRPIQSLSKGEKGEVDADADTVCPRRTQLDRQASTGHCQPSKSWNGTWNDQTLKLTHPQLHSFAVSE
jgi:hypothetical protein